ncbi:MAG: ABC transporter ATP-binding protein [Planctomycetota bacterium]|jgi:peptide/nickel transport system ATP-binding protein
MLLSVRNLKTYFKTKEGPSKAVDGVSFDVDRGETFALVGESGCGKSVTALSIMQLVPKPAGYFAGGEIVHEGRDLLRLPEVERFTVRGSKIGMIFQEPMTALNPVLSVGYQLAEPLKRHKGLLAIDARKTAVEWLGRVGIPEPEQRMREYPHQLSGGMRQRVMIAMAMSCEPGLLIADEPTTALDVTVQAQILDLMNDLQKKTGAAVLLITHDLSVVAETADRVAVLYAGRVAETATASELLAKPAHPYTIRLLQSLPSETKRENRLLTIEGRVPPATRYPEGCRFAPRCHRAHEHCRPGDPGLVEVGPGHAAACVLYDEALQGRKVAPDEVRLATEPRPRESAGAEGGEVVSVRGLKVHFPIRKGILRRTVGHVRAVDGVDLDIRRGETLALVGESGCGKTTLGKALLRLVPATEGAVMAEGVDLTKLSRAELKAHRRAFQIMFQDPYSSLDPRMMVGATITEGMAVHGIAGSRHERIERAMELMAKVGLDPEMVYRYPHEFSGGQRQRIGVARALAVGPGLIVCDEPTSALDVSVQAQIVNLLGELQREMGLAYLFISHDLSLVGHIAHRVAVMYLGELVEVAPAEALARDPKQPYTKALVSAVPQVDPEDRRKRIILPGEPPSPVNPPSGCRFHPRCPEAFERCSREKPPLYDIGDGRRARCFLLEGEARGHA